MARFVFIVGKPGSCDEWLTCCYPEKINQK
jgi:hypothetical protein